MARSVPVRGVIEGFYGPPWSRAARHAIVDFLGEHQMNAYVYAPKSDAKHRERWREPYDADEAAHFRALAEQGSATGVRFGFAISPGLDMEYGGADDRRALLAKLTPLLDDGVDWFVLALDDIPARPGLAAEQTGLCRWLVEELGGSVRLTLVPTEYVGTHPTPYLAELADQLPAAVDVMWTGPTVCSPTITAADARAWATALGGRPPLVWDNYPVNDASMERSLHLGPYRGRDPDLADEVAGVLCNPMIQPYSSMIALATAADFLIDPDSYEPDQSWRRAVSAVGGGRAEPLAALAEACAHSPLSSPRDLELHRLVDALEGAASADDTYVARRALHDSLAEARAAREAWSEATDDPLGVEIAPWLAQLRREADVGLAALRLLAALGPELDPQDAMLHAFAVVFGWDSLRRANRVVFGPRFAVYAAVVQLRDGAPGVDPDLAVVEDGSAIDRLCRIALAGYRNWVDERR